MSLPNPVKADRFLYIFLDEAGNLDFSPASGSRYFVLGGITKERPFYAYKELTELKYDLVEGGTALEYFHASENAQAVRNKVFDIIERNLAGVWVDPIIVEKQKGGSGVTGGGTILSAGAWALIAGNPHTTSPKRVQGSDRVHG